jgi:DNA-directed RNA polymerase specialized sigma24 family protein
MTTLSMTTLASTHRHFEAALPAIHQSARYLLRHRRRDRDDLIAELTACCWKAWLGLLERGKDPLAVGLNGIIGWAARHTLKGRRIGNSNVGRGAMDIFNRRAQKAGSFRVISYNYGPATETGSKSEVWREWLVADRRASPGDSAAFRIDFSSWLDELPERRRRTAELLAEGYGTGEVARKLGISAAAVSQARLWLEKSWREFQGELPGVASSRPLHLVPGSA